ncbi:ribosome hibernation-promoting factor, HPF/YfiA family [Thermoactinomyces sp. CICC 10521]|jgi:putative sigma-54 modulation protein|uniref:ribosome hibernation-promoting factor, HPF/YfiA family n=1 Tax=Thermoactinomyces sp. CICC 10521 TaxID=2767426 RepID=UPI0018DB16D5|nr:ribosome-associated translation inhibitor RaiA [Thermoactinomyces sp. CICC 10521]MBH8608658.1 ribosome-associated translation inhibitor RaiA [Thermoactinomyces sp. CICC 10521]
MRYVIRGNNFQVTDALKDFAARKLGRLEKYFDSSPNQEAEAHVAMSVIKDQHKVEVTIPYPGLLCRAEESSEDMYASVDLVVEKLERQIRKYKTRVNRKSRQDASFRNNWKESAYNETAVTAVTEEENDLKVVRTKRFNLKPMGTEEAILQMDMLGHNFFVFTNADTNLINVIYRRKDGKYGLIEPE